MKYDVIHALTYKDQIRVSGISCLLKLQIFMHRYSMYQLHTIMDFRSGKEFSQ